MTIEELAELTGPKLAALSNEELEAILKPYYTVTRPEMVEKKKPKQQYTNIISNLSPEKIEALKLMKEKGIDLTQYLLPIKKHK